MINTYFLCISFFNYILFLAISSYFTPNFCFFSIFFIFKFFQKYKFTWRIYTLIILNFLLALPAILFLFKKKFFFFEYDVANINFLDKINIANKIILVSTIICFHLLPFLFNIIKKIAPSKKNFILIIIIYFISIIFFNFPQKYNGGGGVGEKEKTQNLIDDLNSALPFLDKEDQEETKKLKEQCQT